MVEFPSAPPPVEAATLLRLVTWMAEAGLVFAIDQSPHYTFWLEPPHVVDYLHNPEAFVAAALGVSVAEYRGWKEAAGALQCHARRRGGRGPRCRKMIAESSDYLRPKEWAELQRQHPTCWVHGGASRKARVARPYDGVSRSDMAPLPGAVLPPVAKLGRKGQKMIAPEGTCGPWHGENRRGASFPLPSPLKIISSAFYEGSNCRKERYKPCHDFMGLCPSR
jgi:hypothetical protein